MGAGGLPAWLMPCLTPQNKCFRYWPELHGSQEYGHLHVCNMAEHWAQGYCVRELQVWRPDQVSLKSLGSLRARVMCSGSPQVCAGLAQPPPKATSFGGFHMAQPTGQSPGLGHAGQ